MARRSDGQQPLTRSPVAIGSGPSWRWYCRLRLVVGVPDRTEAAPWIVAELAKGCSERPILAGL